MFEPTRRTSLKGIKQLELRAIVPQLKMKWLWQCEICASEKKKNGQVRCFKWWIIRVSTKYKWGVMEWSAEQAGDRQTENEHDDWRGTVNWHRYKKKEKEMKRACDAHGAKSHRRAVLRWIEQAQCSEWFNVYVSLFFFFFHILIFWSIIRFSSFFNANFGGLVMQYGGFVLVLGCVTGVSSILPLLVALRSMFIWSVDERNMVGEEQTKKREQSKSNRGL